MAHAINVCASFEHVFWQPAKNKIGGNDLFSAMFISEETEVEAINSFREARWADSTHKMEYFFLFLIMKRLGISVTDSVTNADFLASSKKRELLMETLLVLPLGKGC
jgi:hypothetical protein